MSLAHDRIINGLLKSAPLDGSPEEFQRRLAIDFVIVAPPHRAHLDDLWPCIWLLAAILERQFSGTVCVRCGLQGPLLSPAPLGPRVRFDDGAPSAACWIALGDAQPDNATSLAGDARQGAVSMQGALAVVPPPTPIECAILAGLLGFAALARAVGIPAHREELAQPVLPVTYDAERLREELIRLPGLTSVGVGQIGQAYLAVLFFWYRGQFSGRQVALIDDDRFQKENGRTQLLLDPHRADGPESWVGDPKVGYLASVIRPWNINARTYPMKITWGFQRSADLPALALLGLHDLEGRRIACAAGFERLIESGVGTDFLRPRVTWHALSGPASIGRRFFPEPTGPRVAIASTGSWTDELRATPGNCGWVEFERISATAPCLGAVAAGFALAELGCPRLNVTGSALLWSSGVPAYRVESSL